MLHLGILNRNSELFWLMVWILIIEWLMWNSFRASNAGKGILQCSGMGRYWELSGGLGAWNLETIRVWYLIWSIFWDKCPKFSDLQFLGTIYLLSISEWNETNLPGLLLQTGAWIQTEFGTFFDKNAQKLDFRLGHLEILVIYIKCTRSPPVRTRSWLNSGCEDLLFQIYYKLVVPMINQVGLQKGSPYY